MKFECFRFLFQIGTLILVLLAASPTTGLIIDSSRNSEKYTQFFLLDSNHKVGDYPFKVQEGEQYFFFLRVKNNLGFSAYYRVYTTLLNQSKISPNGDSIEESSIQPIYDWQFLIQSGDYWEIPISFKILNTSKHSDSLIIERVSLNERIYEIECSSEWDMKQEGFYFQLFFELWRYDEVGGTFRFDDRVVCLWFTVTDLHG